MTFVKFSILAFYGDIFPRRRLRQTLFGLAIFMGAWAISASFAGIFQCTPTEYGWNPSLEGGSCIDYGKVVLVAGAFNIITDFVILLLPVPLIWGLEMSAQEKRMLLLAFFLGGSACIVSITRVAFAYVVSSTVDGSCKSSFALPVVSLPLLGTSRLNL